MVSLSSSSSIQLNALFLFCSFIAIEVASADQNPFGFSCHNWNEKCPPASPIQNCVVDPCSVAKACPKDSGFVCHSNYCGGCRAICWWEDYLTIIGFVVCCSFFLTDTNKPHRPHYWNFQYANMRHSFGQPRDKSRKPRHNERPFTDCMCTRCSRMFRWIMGIERPREILPIWTLSGRSTINK